MSEVVSPLYDQAVLYCVCVCAGPKSKWWQDHYHCRNTQNLHNFQNKSTTLLLNSHNLKAPLTPEDFSHTSVFPSFSYWPNDHYISHF